MLLRVRRLLPKIVGAAWLFVSWRWLLGAPDNLDSFFRSLAAPPVRLSEWDALGWIGLLFLTMLVVDRIFLFVAARIWGIDPYSVPWWQLRTEDGRLLCARCRGTFFLPPPSMAPDESVTCERCGRPVATLAEFRRRA